MHWVKQRVYNFLCGTLVDRKNFDHFGVATQGWWCYILDYFIAKCKVKQPIGNMNLNDFSRCTDGIVFVVDSVDVERMEEAKMELMRTAKCSENHVSHKFTIRLLSILCIPLHSFIHSLFIRQGVPILIFANKQDLPGAKEPKELEKLLGLHELSFSVIPSQMIKSSSTLPVSANISSGHKPIDSRLNSLDSKSTDASSNCSSSTPPPHTSTSTSSSTSPHHASSTITTTSSSTTSTSHASSASNASTNANANATLAGTSFKGWYIQPACAITGDGLQEGLEALYDMIMKKRKLNKAHKKKRC